MARLEGISRDSSIRGISPEGLDIILDVKWPGTVAIEVAFNGNSCGTAALGCLDGAAPGIGPRDLIVCLAREKARGDGD